MGTEYVHISMFIYVLSAIATIAFGLFGWALITLVRLNSRVSALLKQDEMEKSTIEEGRKAYEGMKRIGSEVISMAAQQKEDRGEMNARIQALERNYVRHHEELRKEFQGRDEHNREIKRIEALFDQKIISIQTMISGLIEQIRLLREENKQILSEVMERFKNK